MKLRTVIFTRQWQASALERPTRSKLKPTLVQEVKLEPRNQSVIIGQSRRILINTWLQPGEFRREDMRKLFQQFSALPPSLTHYRIKIKSKIRSGEPKMSENRICDCPCPI